MATPSPALFITVEHEDEHDLVYQSKRDSPLNITLLHLYLSYLPANSENAVHKILITLPNHR
ncbi:MAG: hypothetical protein A4E71_00503 [Smithella sp. PtaU1.Bin162]|jgi:hypothetical protein|nr:MAG: hypothetical protein A4E71_00503 [Smithella sp. PtaU1.Bin162]